MRKILSLLGLSVGFLWATQARIVSLGGFGDWFIDEANIPRYPSALLEHRELVWVDLGAGGATGSMSSASVWITQPVASGAVGLSLNTRPMEEYLGWRLGAWALPDRGASFWGGVRAAGVEAAAGLEQASRSSTDDATGVSTGSEVWAWSLGLGGGRDVRWDLSLRRASIEAWDSSQNLSLSGSAWAWAARLLAYDQEQRKLVGGLFGYSDVLGDTSSYSESNIFLGLHTIPTGLRDLYLGLLWRSWSESLGGQKASLWGVAGAASLEVQPTSWLWVRLGAIKYFMGEYKDPNVARSVRDFYANMGLGLGFGDLRLDGVLSPELLYRGPYLVGGREVGFWYVSVRYKFRFL